MEKNTEPADCTGNEPTDIHTGGSRQDIKI